MKNTNNPNFWMLPSRKKLTAFSFAVTLGFAPLIATAQTEPSAVPETKKSDQARVRLGEFTVTRYNEDWSFLKNSPQKNTFPNDLKFVPLNEKQNIYVTFLGELRIRNINETSHSDALGPTTNPAKNIYTQSRPVNFTAIRTDFGADVHVTKYFRAFVQFVSGQDLGNNIGHTGAYHGEVPTSFESPIQLLQGFAEPRLYIDHAQLGLRIGREVLSFGNGTIIDANDFPNFQAPYDVIHPFLKYGDLTIDGFVSHQVTMEYRPFSDYGNADISLSGLYISKRYHTHIFGMPVVGELQPFFFAWHNTSVEYGDVGGKLTSGLKGPDTRRDYGARVTAKFGGWDFDIEGLKQGGTFEPDTTSTGPAVYGRRSVNAWAYFTQEGYTFRDVRFAPRLGIQADGMSGGSLNKSGTEGAYQPIDASALYLAASNTLGATNLIDFRPNVTLHLTPKITVKGWYGFYWRQTLSDSIYVTAPLLPYAKSNNTYIKGRMIAQIPQLDASWAFTPRVSLAEIFAVLLPAPALVEAGGGKGDIFSATTLTLRF